MNVVGYGIGPIACKAAFMADFDVATDIPMPTLVDRIDDERRTMAAQSGMRSKYVPLRFDPATGAHQIGGRYLFDAWADVEDYVRFIRDLEFEPGVTFWERSFFSNISKLAWHVVGAYEFAPLETHYASRFERFTFDAPLSSKTLDSAWHAIRDAAQAKSLASVWLLKQREERQIGLLTATAQVASNNSAKSASLTLAALEARPSLGAHLGDDAVLQPVFDRTSLNLSIWLPVSDRLGGDASVFPTFPVHPTPRPSS